MTHKSMKRIHTCIADGCGKQFDPLAPELRDSSTLRPFWQRYCTEHRDNGKRYPAITEQARPTKRILSVTVKRMSDDSPDTSWLGEYSDDPTSEFTIDRKHSLDCPINGVPLFSPQCDCGERGDWNSRELRYFNGPVENYKGLDAAEIRKYVLQDYKRMESLNRGDFCFIGIRAEAEIQLGSDVVQHITSGGLWGIESDSDKEYLASIEQEQLDELKGQLAAVGFSKRAIAAAFRNVEHKEE